ncbi:hypothetical protein AURDEDRAFT_109804 [Auricularia subglabra TFB-10046 SS5]|nr:hypothetical protein AURDEDRAFT_109804 [Auricularia subglabra TFB-10046 SS5]
MPHLEPADVSHLRPWLVRTLEPICDADPQVLADYVLALLKHDASEAELRDMFSKQLADFLEQEAPAFTEQLLAALRTKSYMPYAADAPLARSEDPGIPIPLDALVPPAAGQKRSAEGDDFDRAPPKGPRLSSDGNFSRYGPGPSHSNGGAWRGGEQRGQGAGRGGYANGGANGRPQNDMSQRGPRRGLCRDYHNLGYCARGALCPYSHGNDAVVPQMGFGAPPGAPPGMPFVPVMGAQFGMPFAMAPGGAYDPTQAQMGMGNRHPGGEQVIQDLTPRPEGAPDGRPRPQNGGMRRQQYPADAQRGTFAGAQNFDDGSANARGPRKGENKTLVVEKIPPEHLSLEGVNTWFKRFGTVTNVAIDAKGAKALVSFATPTEAHAAWKSEDAVFGNRFVKVFWHRPMAGHGAAGQKMLAASAPLITNITAKESPSSEEPSNGSLAPPAAATPALKKKPVDAAALASKQQLLERQIAEQKTLMARYSSASSSEEKQQIMARLRQLKDEMKSEPAAPTPTADAEQKKKELLDKELEIVAAGTEAEGSSSTTEALKAKLAKLREEAASLGITDPSAPAYPGSTFRGYRGRGRGGARGYYRGRGAVPMRNMKLDNRPRKLIVKGTPGDDEALQTVRGYYDSMGQVESASTLPSGDIVISFSSRSFAEQAFARPTSITGIGSVEVAWHSEAPSGVVPTASNEPQTDGGEDTLMKEEPEARSPRRDDDDDEDMRRMHDDDWDDEDDRRRRR